MPQIYCIISLYHLGKVKISMKKIYTSIDIGSDSIKIVTAEYYNKKIYVLASHSIKAKGIRKGLVVDSNLAINAIKDGIKVVSEKLGFNIKKVIVSVPDYNAKFMYVTGTSRVEGAITPDNLATAIKASVYGKLEENYELVTVEPLEYLIDGEKVEGSIINKTANKLDVNGIMISVPKKNIYSVIETVENAGLEVVEICLSALADYAEVQTDIMDKKVGAIVNIGHETTNVSVFSKGKLMNTETLQIGGVNVDKDLSYIFGINVFDGRSIKEKFASAHKRFTGVGDLFPIQNNYGEIIRLNQLEVSEVVMSRLNQILDYAKKQIMILTKHPINYIIITGGMTEIKSFKNLVYENMGKDVIIYTESTLGVRDNKYATALGMIKYYIRKMKSRGKDYSMITDEDENRLVNPRKNKPKPEERSENEVQGITKLWGNIFKGKEEK